MGEVYFTPPPQKYITLLAGMVWGVDDAVVSRPVKVVELAVSQTDIQATVS